MTQPYNLIPRLNSTMAEEWLAIGLEHHVVAIGDPSKVTEKLAAAEQAYMKGLRIDPACGAILGNLGVMAAQQNNMTLALQRMERSLLFDEKNPTLWYNYALALLEAERAHEAAKAIENSIALAPSANAHTAQGMILTSNARAAEAAESYDKALATEPTHPMASYNAIFVRTLKDTSPEENFVARKRWYEAHRFKGEKLPHTNDKTPDRVLRVGYVGGDFKMHSAAFIFGTIILNHDRQFVDPYCYMSMTPDAEKDISTKNFATRTNWRLIDTLDDAQADAMIRQDKIDILVDLAGHTGGNRLGLFTRKPAPVQVHAWGFAHGSGVPEIDYFFGDQYAIPEEERQFFAEKIWDLPTIVCYTAPDYGAAGVSPAPVGRDGVFSFGVFGRFEKFSPQALECWHKIMQQTTDTRLVFKDLMMRRPYVIKYIREVMHDIDPKRLLFVQDCSHPEQLLAYQNVDLVLDTFPHTGGVTALEMLHMGVPVITLYNGQVGGRTTAVALRAIGRQSWIADSPYEYVHKAIKLSEDRTELSKARMVLRKELSESPICGAEYVRAVEAAYRAMWWRYCGHDADHSRDTGVVEQFAADGLRAEHGAAGG